MALRKFTRVPKFFLVRYLCDQTLQVRGRGYVRIDENLDVVTGGLYEVQWGRSNQVNTAVVLASGDEKEMRADLQRRNTETATNPQPRSSTSPPPAKRQRTDDAETELETPSNATEPSSPEPRSPTPPSSPTRPGSSPSPVPPPVPAPPQPRQQRRTLAAKVSKPLASVVARAPPPSDDDDDDNDDVFTFHDDDDDNNTGIAVARALFRPTSTPLNTGTASVSRTSTVLSRPTTSVSSASTTLQELPTTPVVTSSPLVVDRTDATLLGLVKSLVTKNTVLTKMLSESVTLLRKLDAKVSSQAVQLQVVQEQIQHLTTLNHPTSVPASALVDITTIEEDQENNPYNIATSTLLEMKRLSLNPGNFAVRVVERLFPELFGEDNLRFGYSYNGGGVKNKKGLDEKRKGYLRKYVCQHYPEVKEIQAWKMMVVNPVNERLRRPVEKKKDLLRRLSRPTLDLEPDTEDIFTRL